MSDWPTPLPSNELGTALKVTSQGRKPTYILKFLEKNSEHRSGRVGCGYLKTDGTIQILLDYDINPFLAGTKNFVLTLFPTESRE